jgi:hypothetical protein
VVKRNLEHRLLVSRVMTEDPFLPASQKGDHRRFISPYGENT